MTQQTLPAKARQEIERIAVSVLRVETLQERKSDSLDFYDLAVWQLEEALAAAYRAGQNSK